MVKISDRLKTAASLIREGAVLADVGTDHGYVPIYLLEQKKIKSAIAMDINKGPLERAREHIHLYGMDAYIQTRLSDGVAALEKGEADSILIAGMGGGLVMHILEEGKDICQAAGELILQPQSELCSVREYLAENGYVTESERMVFEDGKYYPMMRVHYKAEKNEDADKAIKDMENRLIRNLSKGYKQRVGFAQALLGNPEYLILDEPTVGLDPSQVVEVRNLIMSLKKEHTIILSSHILQEIQAVCERVVIISHGEIRAMDTIKHLEDSMGTSVVINIKAEGDREKVSACISSVAGIGSVTEVISEGGNVNTYKISAENDDVRKEILSALVKNDISVSEVSSERPSLEEVFVQLTASAPKKRDLRDLLNEMESENPYYDKEEQ